ncbi:MAG: hypothetical protein RLY30_900 [Pseudomonadota bacterium]|jgi:TRAP-type mannitol/chloroaromatic compound transport system permease small subunit
MQRLQPLFFRIDAISTRIGQTFSWLMVPLTLMICYEVFARYFLNQAHAWAFDVQMMLYGSVFMMAGAYTLAKSGHVRGDILYGFLTSRQQAIIDLILYIVFFLPGVAALVYAGILFAGESWAIQEHSSITADGPPIYPFKTIIPLAGGLLMLQGIVEILRCVLCIQTGEWPSRERDVEEVDVEALREMVHADDIVESNTQAAR